MTITERKELKGKHVLTCFVLFFGTILTLNVIFAYTAINTQTGLVTDKAYEKGLNYNKVIDAAQAQPHITDKLKYEHDRLTWHITDEAGQPITNAQVKAVIRRAVQDGYDFEITLPHLQNGTYGNNLNLPLRGIWNVTLSAAWNNQSYHITHDIMAR